MFAANDDSMVLLPMMGKMMLSITTSSYATDNWKMMKWS